MLRPTPSRMRRSGDLYTLEAALARRGLGPVAGVDEAGRGACAGPLVVAAVCLPPSARLDELNDSKLMTEAARERVFERLRRCRAQIAVVSYSPEEIDRRGVGVCNLEGMRVAVARLAERPGYVLTDGFAVPGLPGSLGVVKGDRTAACVAAAGVVAKVTRDRVMTELDGRYPRYGFALHKGYGTAAHEAALRQWGPSDQHRLSYSNVSVHVADGSVGPAAGGVGLARTIVGTVVEKEER